MNLYRQNDLTTGFIESNIRFRSGGKSAERRKRSIMKKDARQKGFTLSILTLIFFFYFLTLSTILASAEGWRFATTCAYNPNKNGAIARNGYLYSIGNSKYQWTLINPDGTLGIWTSAFNNYTGGVGRAVSTTSNLLYGSGGAGIDQSDAIVDRRIWYAGFNPDGSLTTPIIQESPVMQSARIYHASLILNGRLYTFGGYNTNNFPIGSLTSVEYAAINADSSVGSFQYTSSFNQINGAVYLAFNFGNSVYCLGSNPNQSTTYIEQCTLNPNGTLSAWSTIAGPFPFAGPAVLTSRTTLFVIQHYIGGSFNNAYKTGVSPTSGINNFIPVTPPTIPRYGPSIATWDRFVYWMGGINMLTSSSDSSVEFYDPDLTDTELFPDISIIAPSHSMSIIEIHLDMEGKNE